jgi:hypothetical protein
MRRLGDAIEIIINGRRGRSSWPGLEHKEWVVVIGANGTLRLRCFDERDNHPSRRLGAKFTRRETESRLYYKLFVFAVQVETHEDQIRGESRERVQYTQRTGTGTGASAWRSVCAFFFFFFFSAQKDVVQCVSLRFDADLIRRKGQRHNLKRCLDLRRAEIMRR